MCAEYKSKDYQEDLIAMNNNTNCFNIKKNFFIIDSNNLDSVQTKLYGFTIIDDKATEDITNLEISENLENMSHLGAYIYIKREPDKIIIMQDFIGSYGLYLYKEGDYFALSNSFLLLVDYVKNTHKITFNRDYANFFIISGLCSVAYSDTMINEIEVLDRSAIVEINIDQKILNINYFDYGENTVELNSKEGLELLDSWYYKWTNIIRNLQSKTNNIQIDLSGGFDSRLTFLLILGSGIDLNKIYVNSIKDSLHTHKEDFEIATLISNYYNFSLNEMNNICKQVVNYTLEDILNLSFYTKLSFHKQMYFKPSFMSSKRHYFGGSGGECIRSYWNMDETEYIDQCIRRCKSFSHSNSVEFEHSIRTILNSAYEKIRNKYKIFGRNIAPNDMPLNLYRETRCRNHFGKDAVENYLAGMIKYCPLLDPQLHKLKVCDYNCSDKNLLIAVIFDRYCKTLLNFKFEGGRNIESSTIKHAQAINNGFPFNRNSNLLQKNMLLYENNNLENLSLNQTHNSYVTTNEINTFIKNIFYTRFLKGTLSTLYSDEIYSYILQDMQTKKHQPLENVYAAISISTIIQSIYANEIMHKGPFYKYISGYALNTRTNMTLQNHPYLDNYISARIDIKNSSLSPSPSARINDIEIIEISDPDAKITSPTWFANNGKGYVIESKAGRLKIIFKCIYSGKLSITLRGRDVRDKNNQKIPFWIDYCSMNYNSETIFDEVMSVWHDKPFLFNRLVQNGEIVLLDFQWQPHIRK